VTNSRKLVLIIGVVALVPLGILSAIVGANIIGGVYRSTINPYLDSELAQNLTLTNEWVEIAPAKPLRAERQIQYLILTFAESGAPDVPKSGIRLPNGSVVTPEVQLIDQNGRTYNLHAVAFGSSGLSFASQTDLPKDRTFQTVRLRSNETIHVTSVHWRCWNQWDVS
jgi:hypothetical protein